LTAQQELQIVNSKMTNEEKILVLYNRIYNIDNMITEIGHENKSEEESKLYMNLIFRKKALMGVLQDLGQNIENSLENQG
jgi:hypothetical protein